jgi:2,4-dienoyl-CoA reductase (NADPH2)
VAWLIAECERLGVELSTGAEITAADLDALDDAAPHGAARRHVIVATGGRPGTRAYEVVAESMVHDVLDPVVLDGTGLGGTVALWDPIGGPIAVALAERLGRRAVLVTPDQIAGNELSRTGDLAPANVRLQQHGVRIERRSILRSVRAGEIELEDRFSGARRTIAVDALVDCGFRLPDETLAAAAARGRHRSIGDAVAPRTLLEAVLEGRRAALALG